MRLLADENVHPVVVDRLRLAGFSVEWVAEGSPGQADEAILLRPDIGELTLITYDRDFGELIFSRGLPSPYAIIYSRLGRAEPRHVAERIIQLMAGGIAAGHIVTITREGSRSRLFPSGAQNV